MATAEQYAKWIVENKDKKGTPEFDKVAAAYRLTKGTAEKPAEPAKKAEKEQYDPYTFENIAGSAVEPLLTLGTGAVGSVAGGLSGLGTIAGNALGMDLGDPAENVRTIQEGMTYQPRTGGGKLATQAITYPFQKLEEFGEYAGGEQLKAFDSPELATAVKTGIVSLPMLFGVKGAKQLNRESVIPYVDKVGQKVSRVKDITVNAIKNRLPAGSERAAAQGVTEMIGKERFPKVQQALREAKPGETAGQAATGTGAYELSALQKMSEQVLPSQYGAIKKAQISKLDNLLADRFNADPAKLAIAKDLLKQEAAKKYGAIRNQKIDPRSQNQIIEDIAIKADRLAGQARDSKVSALQDVGKFETLAQQQRNLGRGTPSRQASTAANEVKNIVNDRRMAEQAHTEIANILRQNKKGGSDVGMKDFASRPSIQKAIREARLAAMEKGEYFPKTPDEPFTVGNLQRIKRAVSEAIETQKKSEKGLAKTKEAEITNTVEAFNDWIRSKSPEFAKTEDWYKGQVKPVNQMEAGMKLRESLKPKLGEKVADRQFINTFEKMQKKGKLKDITPEQLDAYATVKDALNKDVIMKEQATAGAPAMNKALGTMFDVPTAKILNRAVVIMNAIIKRIEAKNTDVALSTIAKKMQNPKEFSKFLEKANPVERAKLNDAMMQARNQILAAGAIQTAEEQE